MIDLNLLRKEPKKIIDLLKLKEPSYNIQLLFELDQELRAVSVEVDALRKRKNDISDAAKSGLTQELRDESISIGKNLKEKELAFKELKDKFDKLYLECPNIPQEDLPAGNKEANKVVKEFGSKPVFNFEPKNHVDLGNKLGLLDFEAAAKMTGSNFAFYKGEAVNVIYSLAMMMLKNNIKHGYTPLIPPFLVNETSLTVASNFPKFRDQVYEVTEDKLYLTPTSEVNLTNLYRDHIFNSNELPVRMTSWTQCFRREAGNYGASERGLIRIHQFDKVELYTICEPKEANQEQERMLACAEDILKQLGLHYRISMLAMQDCSFASSKTYDIEVWMPGQKAYYEVSSISNCTDFQARRGGIRYREYDGAKTQYAYTLNASSLAFPRLLVALMETYQKEDGTVEFPAILKQFGIY